MVDFDKIWVEKYRPQTLDDIILDEETLRVVKEFKSEIPNILFVGNISSISSKYGKPSA